MKHLNSKFKLGEIVRISKRDYCWSINRTSFNAYEYARHEVQFVIDRVEYNNHNYYYQLSYESNPKVTPLFGLYVPEWALVSVPKSKQLKYQKTNNVLLEFLNGDVGILITKKSDMLLFENFLKQRDMGSILSPKTHLFYPIMLKYDCNTKKVYAKSTSTVRYKFATIDDLLTR